MVRCCHRYLFTMILLYSLYSFLHFCGIIFIIHLLYQTCIDTTFNMGVDWSVIVRLMEVSTMLYKCTYCVFTLCGRTATSLNMIVFLSITKSTELSLVLPFCQQSIPSTELPKYKQQKHKNRRHLCQSVTDWTMK